LDKIPINKGTITIHPCFAIAVLIFLLLPHDIIKITFDESSAFRADDPLSRLKLRRTFYMSGELGIFPELNERI
jgi:hypothetical protein